MQEPTPFQTHPGVQKVLEPVMLCAVLGTAIAANFTLSPEALMIGLFGGVLLSAGALQHLHTVELKRVRY